jgi:hypothetical protein
MPIRTFALMAAVVLDTFVVSMRLPPTLGRLANFVPFRSFADWMADWYPVVLPAFLTAGVVAVVWAVRDESVGPLLFWNLCYLAILGPGSLVNGGEGPNVFFVIRPWLVAGALLSCLAACRVRRECSGPFGCHRHGLRERESGG